MKHKNIIIKLFVSFFFFLLPANANVDIKASTAILQDFLSGKILYEKDPDAQIYPASMTKIMTSIIAFDLIKKGDLDLNDKFLVSENAWRLSKSGYSSMFIMVGDEVSVEDLLRGIIVASGNDACMALAEGLSGTEQDFVVLMNEKAEELGLENTNFNNSSGINDVNNYSTVKDILIMSQYMIQNYPEYYSYFKDTTFTWDRTGGDPITQGNRNPLLYKNIGADGIKTGFLTVEKYSLASSIKHGDRRINAVASGFKTKNSRSRESVKILTWALRSFDTIQVATKNEVIDSLDVWLGKKNKVEAVVLEDIYVTVPKRKKKIIKAVIEYNTPIEAPIAKGDKLGSLNIYVAGELKKKIDVLSGEEIKKANIFSRLLKSFNFLVWGNV